MTHDEVMAWIDEHLENLAIILADPRPEELSIWDYFNASLLANRAVLERHKSKDYFGIREVCSCCIGSIDNGTPLVVAIHFPCPTYTDIAKHLDLVMGGINE